MDDIFQHNHYKVTIFEAHINSIHQSKVIRLSKYAERSLYEY